MERKIIKQGIDSYTITLPREWVKEHYLAPGDGVGLVPSEGGLLLVPKPQARPIRTISLRKATGEIQRNELFQAYRRGFDRITVPYENAEGLRAIKRLVRQSMLGFEVIETDGKTCIIENVAEPSGDKFYPILRKFLYLIKESSHSIIQELRSGKPQKEEREEQKIAITHYTNYLQRMVLREQIVSKADSSMLFFIIAQLESAAMRYYYLIDRATKGLSLGLLTELDETIELVDVIYDCVFKKDTTKAFDLRKKKIAHFDRFYASIVSNKGQDNIALYHLAEIVRSLQIAGSTALGCDFGEVKE